VAELATPPDHAISPPTGQEKRRSRSQEQFPREQKKRQRDTEDQRLLERAAATDRFYKI